MEAALLAITFAWFVAAEVPTKEVVVLPLVPTELDDARAVEAWEQTFARLEEHGRRAGLVFRKHRLGRRALYNARAEIFACPEKPSCALAYARSLGAAWAVTGEVSSRRVRLELYDVETERLILGAESSPALEGKGPKAQLEASVRGLLEELPAAQAAASAEARAEARKGGTP